MPVSLSKDHDRLRQRKHNYKSIGVKGGYIRCNSMMERWDRITGLVNHQQSCHHHQTAGRISCIMPPNTPNLLHFPKRSSSRRRLKVHPPSLAQALTASRPTLMSVRRLVHCTSLAVRQGCNTSQTRTLNRSEMPKREDDVHVEDVSTLVTYHVALKHPTTPVS